jgi:hypothetical protein
MSNKLLKRKIAALETAIQTLLDLKDELPGPDAQVIDDTIQLLADASSVAKLALEEGEE